MRAVDQLVRVALLAGLATGCTTKQSEDPEPTGPYRRASSLETGAAPASLALADFDADAKLDLVVANNGSDSLGVFRGSGKGGFTNYSELTTGKEPRSVASGDFDADGAPDIAACDSASDTLTVYFGQGDGSFSARTEIATGLGPTFVVAGKLNQDARDDLLVTNADGNSITVLLADAQGGFESPVDFDAGTNPVRAVLVDLSSDGVLDVVTATRVVPPTVSLLLGDGQGGFGSPTKYKASNRPGIVFPIAPLALTAGDVNGDGQPDVLVGNRGLDVLDGEVWLLSGDGTGTLSAPAEVPGVTVLAPAFLDLVDLNGDGALDVIETDHDPSLAAVLTALGADGYGICVAHGDGAGSFAHAACLPTGDYPYEVDTGDLDGNGQLDLVSADAGSDTVSVYLAKW